MHSSSGITLSTLSYPMIFSFYTNSLLYGEIPAGQVMVGKTVPKMDPRPHLQSFYSINHRNFSRGSRGDADLDVFVPILPYTTFN